MTIALISATRSTVWQTLKFWADKKDAPGERSPGAYFGFLSGFWPGTPRPRQITDLREKMKCHNTVQRGFFKFHKSLPLSSLFSLLVLLAFPIMALSAQKNFHKNHSLRKLALTLFMLRILANYSDTTFSLDDFAFLANGFYRWSYFHRKNPPFTSCVLLPLIQLGFEV